MWRYAEELQEGTPLFGGNGSQNGDRVYVYDDTKAADMIARARDGDPDADSVLCVIAAKFVRCDFTLPPLLRDYINQLLERRAHELHYGEGGNKHANAIRNLSIREAVVYLREKYAIENKTRAIGLVRRALDGVHISADGIRQALKRLPGESVEHD